MSTSSYQRQIAAPGAAFALSLLLSPSASAAGSLLLDAPDGCAHQSDLDAQLAQAGLPARVNAATLKIEAAPRVQSGTPQTEAGTAAPKYTARLVVVQDGNQLVDQQQTETCAAALAWGAFSWNNMFIVEPNVAPEPETVSPTALPARTAAAAPSSTESAVRPSPEAALSLGLGLNSLFGLGDATHKSDIQPGLSGRLAADFQHFRLAAWGGYYAPLKTQGFPAGTTRTRQRAGGELCALSGNPLESWRVGGCVGANINFLQFNTNADTTIGNSQARWWDAALAAVGNFQLPLNFLVEARVSAAFSPSSVNLYGPHGEPPATRFVIEPMLLLGYALEVNGVNPSTPAATNVQALEYASAGERL